MAFSTTWAATNANAWISGNVLQNAVNTGVFTIRPSQTIPATDQWVLISQVPTLIFATVVVSGSFPGSGPEWPQKIWIIPITSTTSTSTSTTTSTTSSTTTTTTTVLGTYNLAVTNSLSSSLFVKTVTINNDVPKQVADFSSSGNVNPGQTKTYPFFFPIPLPENVTKIDIGFSSSSGVNMTADMYVNGVFKFTAIRSDYPAGSGSTFFTIYSIPLNTIVVGNGDTLNVTLSN